MDSTQDHQKTDLAVFLKPCCPSKLFELFGSTSYNCVSDNWCASWDYSHQVTEEKPDCSRVFFRLEESLHQSDIVVKPLIFKVKAYTANMIYTYQKELQ